MTEKQRNKYKLLAKKDRARYVNDMNEFIQFCLKKHADYKMRSSKGHEKV